MVCDLLVTPISHMGFQRIFNYRPEHLILVKPLYISVDYTYNRTIVELVNVGFPTGTRFLGDYLSKLMLFIKFPVIIM